jgi:antitoxin component HigA of HigAB toxin-antitoxin module
MIRSDEEFDQLSAELEQLDAMEEVCEIDKDRQALLAHLCTEYEDRTVEPSGATPLDALRFVMDQNGPRPVDLTDVFGSRSETIVQTRSRSMPKY